MEKTLCQCEKPPMDETILEKGKVLGRAHFRTRTPDDSSGNIHGRKQMCTYSKYRLSHLNMG